MVRRRLLTIPLLFLLTASLTLLAPPLILLALVLSLLPGLRGALPTLLFILGYLWAETLGVLASFWIWLRHREHEAFLQANQRLQFWWANLLYRMAESLFRLSFQVEGETALPGHPVIMLPRHASIADTIIPIVFYARPQQRRLRYVMKQELLIDPCLDIVGHRLPNVFVDRGGSDSDKARGEVARLISTVSDNEGVLLYPEGTRFSRAKHEALRRRYADNPEMLGQLDRWTELLPPRLGGVLALLEANPGLDLLFCAHIGFEGSSHFGNLINGSWMGAAVRLRFWRVPFSDIPRDEAGRRALLFREWDEMHRAVRDLARQAERPPYAAG